MKNIWIITEDHISDPCETSSFGVMSHGFPFNTFDAFNGRKDEVERLCPIPFRMYDGDGNLYYEGRMADYDFDPLDDFGKPNAGCTELRFLAAGKWEVL